MNDETKLEVLRHIDSVLEFHMQEEDRRFDELLEDMKELKTEMKAFTDAWQQARGVFTFIKWMAGIAGGVATFFLFVKDHWR